MPQIDLQEVREYIKGCSPETAIYVGSDSKCFSRNKERMVAYITVVVIHIDGNKGAKVFKGLDTEKHFGSLRQRLMTEVGYAATAAYEIAEAVGSRPFEVHLDLNPNPYYKSSQVVKEAMGYILGTVGFKPHVKPESIMASNCADRWAKLCAV
ncbi:MAG: hypothetical protein GY810_01015 [Aureispira sp.]|nr:hypothetical protein [Aureispira sp.]